MTKTDRISITR